MAIIKPTLPDYDPLAWAKLPLGERGRMVCEAWAVQGYGTPLAVFALYGFKVAFYIGAWVWFCGFTPGLGGVSDFGSWWLHPVAFQKAILWSMLFEVLGLGCGSGPLTGRYMPPVGAVLYWLRPGTTKMPVFPGAPVIGGFRRNLLDVALYAGVLVTLTLALVRAEPGFVDFLPPVILLAVLGLFDRTIFLAARAEHYWVTLIVFLFATPWIAGAKAVQCALWFFAGFSKLNHHFPTVVCVMNSNSPFTALPWFRKLFYVDYPRDLRPSTVAVWSGHAGTALELSVPLVLLFAPEGWPLVVGMVMMLFLHTYIVSNIPMGVPIEWNFMVVYGAFALFWAHPEIHVWDVGPPWIAAFLLLTMIAIPVLGNLFPRYVSFLLAMRYYAGNWPWSVWLFKGESYRKLERLTKSAPWVYDQLALMYDRRTSVGLVGKVMAFRMMHLHGRAIPRLLPKAIDGDLADYEYLDGEIVAGLALGWNFGDGHLHREPLLRALQEQCEFAPGEVRCLFVESQPLHRSDLEYRIHDAATGLIEEGLIDARELRTRQPWEASGRS